MDERPFCTLEVVNTLCAVVAVLVELESEDTEVLVSVEAMIGMTVRPG